MDDPGAGCSWVQVVARPQCAEITSALQVGRGACVVSHTGSESDTAVSPELAAEAVASMHEHERTVTSRFPVEHPRRLRILWPATLLPQSPPPQQALNSASSRAGAGATHGGAAAARLRWLARKAVALPERVATGDPALPVDLAGPGPQAMHVRMVVATQPAAAGLPPRWLGIRTALDWVRRCRRAACAVAAVLSLRTHTLQFC